MFTSILNTTTSSLTITNTLICFATSLILGLIVALVYMNQGDYSKNFVLTLVLFPSLVQVVIMMVNGNLGTSIAVAGTFGLTRFRSAPGTSKEITNIFLAMAIGLATGMGYITFAIMFTVVACLVLFTINKSNFGERKLNYKELKVTIPENLDYTEIFDDIFEQYTKKADLKRVKTVNLGSMYELVYDIALKDINEEKAMIDQLRCRNGNLTIVCGRPLANPVEGL